MLLTFKKIKEKVLFFFLFKVQKNIKKQNEKTKENRLKINKMPKKPLIKPFFLIIV